jgi:hypothetical protein
MRQEVEVLAAVDQLGFNCGDQTLVYFDLKHLGQFNSIKCYYRICIPGLPPGSYIASR